MSIDGVNILFSWICGDEESEISNLKEQAAAGNEQAKIELAALDAENAENVSENIAFLEQAAQKDDVAANLYLGVIYSEGIAENGDTQKPKVILPQDWNKSNSYLEKAIGLGSIAAYSVRGMHTWLHCCTFWNRDDEDEADNIMEPPVAQDYLDGEKYLLEFVALKDDKTLDEEKKAYVEELFEIFASWLSGLYGCENPVSPIYNKEKSLEWEKKQAEVKK